MARPTRQMAEGARKRSHDAVPASPPHPLRRRSDRGEALGDATRMLESLVQLGTVLTSCRSAADAAQQVVDYGALLLRLPSLLLFLKSGPRSRYRVAAAETPPGDCVKASLAPIDVAGLDLEREGARALPVEALRSRTLLSACRRTGLQTAWVAPIVVDGDWVRGLLVGLDRRRPPDDDAALRVFWLLTLQAAGAIANADRHQAEQRLRRQARREATVSTALLRSIDALAGSVGLDAVLHTIVEAAAEATGRERAVVLRYEADSRELVVAAGRGGALSAGTRLPVDDLAPGARRSLERAETVVVDHEEAGMSAASRSRATMLDARLSLSAPLVLGGRVIGVLGLDQPGSRRAFSRREVDLVEGIASQAAVAVENAELFEQQRRSARSRDALNAIDEVLLSTLDVDELLGRVVAHVPRVAAADRCLLAQRTRDGWMAIYDSEEDRLSSQVDRVLAPAGPFALVESTRQPQVIADLGPRQGPDETMPAWHEARAATLVPIMAQDGLFGVLYLGFDRPEAADVADVQFARRLSLALSLALRNAQRYEAERGIATTLQESLLALPERPAGITYAHRYHARDVTRVGGDFYDVFAVDDDRVGITIGDVAGKGPQAAALTSLAKDSIRAYCTEGDKTVGRVLSLTNEVLYRATSLESYLTAFFAVLHVPHGRLVYASAGHTEGCVVGAGGSVARLGPTGPMLGGFGHAVYEEVEVSLCAEDLLFLVTDGLTEARRAEPSSQPTNGRGRGLSSGLHDARRPGSSARSDRASAGFNGPRRFGLSPPGDTLQYGMDRLTAVLGALVHRPLPEVIEQVMDDVLSFSGGVLHDDMAILALRCEACGDGHAGAAAHEPQDG